MVLYVCMYVCMCVCVYRSCVCVCVCVYVCMYVCMYRRRTHRIGGAGGSLVKLWRRGEDRTHTAGTDHLFKKKPIELQTPLCV